MQLTLKLIATTLASTASCYYTDATYGYRVNPRALKLGTRAAVADPVASGGSIVQSIESGVKQGAQWINQHPQAVQTGVNVLGELASLAGRDVADEYFALYARAALAEAEAESEPIDFGGIVKGAEQGLKTAGTFVNQHPEIKAGIGLATMAGGLLLRDAEAIPEPEADPEAEFWFDDYEY